MALFINGVNQAVTQNGTPVAGLQSSDLILARDYTQGYYGLLSNFYLVTNYLGLYNVCCDS